MYQFEHIEYFNKDEITYYCNFGSKKFNLCDHTVSGDTKISLYYWTRGDVNVSLYSVSLEYGSWRLGKFPNYQLAKMFLETCVESFNKSIREQLQQEYAPGGQKYCESEKKINELKN